MELTLRDPTAAPEEPMPFPEFARKRRGRVLELLASGES
jgi:hypothetical protein